jgi:hypothetical protein
MRLEKHRPRGPARVQARVLQALRDSEHLRHEREEHVRAERRAAHVRMHVRVRECGHGRGRRGRMRNIPRANWSAASMGSSGGVACVCARPPAVRSAVMAASGERGWGNGGVRVWLLGAGRERARGCERGQGGLLPRHFVGERDERAAPCDWDAPVVGACGVRGDVIAGCLAGEVVTCVEHVKGEPVWRGGCRFAGAHGEGGVSCDDVAKEKQCDAKGGSLLANTPT